MAVSMDRFGIRILLGDAIKKPDELEKRKHAGLAKRLHRRTGERGQSYPFISANLPFISSSNSNLTYA